MLYFVNLDFRFIIFVINNNALNKYLMVTTIGSMELLSTFFSVIEFAKFYEIHEFVV